ncbi:S-layer homology domain-containing protein [Paenibacillus harenae]|uniref:S-layer homology domain-containing protein n=1 Tax=Paenibacillus harenae TaxID=306543 RepID=UPI000429E2B0|nr:S-layer homology domain-containing protein [Paenibacillus harenae]
MTEQGGKIEAFDGKIMLLLPPHAFTGNAQLHISDSEKIVLPSGNEWKAFSAAYTVKEQSGQQLKLPMHLSLTYDPKQLAGVNHLKLGIYREDPQQPGQWKYVGGKVNAMGALIETNVIEHGTYAVLLYDPIFIDLINHWSRKNVEVLISRHIVNGVGKQHFLPERTITRAEISKLLV